MPRLRNKCVCAQASTWVGVMEVIAVVRKLVRSNTHFVTISEDLLPREWEEAVITVAPLGVPWGSKKATFVKGIGGSRIYGSVKVVIPAPVVSHLGLREGDYVWLRFMKGGDVDDEPPFPSIPFLADVRGVHASTGSHFVLVSKTYLGRLVDAMGGDRWSGKVYLAVKMPTGDVARTVTRLYEDAGRNVYYVVLPRGTIKPVLEKMPPGKVKAYVVVAPLPKDYPGGVERRPPPSLPL